jgi:hypothetical protein
MRFMNYSDDEQVSYPVNNTLIKKRTTIQAGWIFFHEWHPYGIMNGIHQGL